MTPAADFVRRFEEYWRGPSVGGLDGLLRADVVLVQPLARRMCGLPRVKEEFARIFELIPDLRGTVDRWSGDDGTVFIEFRLHGSIGGTRVEWPVVDRFQLEQGMATERVSYFDPTPLLRAAAATPSSWPRLLGSRIWRSWL